MMKLPERIEAFSKLGRLIETLPLAEKEYLATRARIENPWFTEDNIKLSLKGIAVLLQEEALLKWIMRYPEPVASKTVGVAMAGNIPFVGFHDFLCVLISGHKLKAKLSSQDTVLFKFILDKLISIEPRFGEMVTVEERLKEIDAIIATGSDNTARYFEFYFRNIPHIIRKNRASCAVLVGEESESEMRDLGADIFSYFGLGCRNVSKLYVPEDFDFGKLIRSWEPYREIVQHHKYANNYEYQKAILLTNLQPFLDGEFIILRQDAGLVSPISILFYEYYADQADLKEKVNAFSSKLQLVASVKGWYDKSVPFGVAQFPGVEDYADNVDTMKFLAGI